MFPSSVIVSCGEYLQLREERNAVHHKSVQSRERITARKVILGHSSASLIYTGLWPLSHWEAKRSILGISAVRSIFSGRESVSKSGYRTIQICDRLRSSTTTRGSFFFSFFRAVFFLFFRAVFFLFCFRAFSFANKMPPRQSAGRMGRVCLSQ